MKIGFDFDNTIVCYDNAISLLAEELFDLPNYIPRTKLGLRDYLRSENRESDWTVFQGELYGPGMRYAHPFDGAISTMQYLLSEGHELTIISHRSRYPYAGPQYDLHSAAHSWIKNELHPYNLFNNSTQHVHFLGTLADKLKRISESNCDLFLDDLTSVVNSPDFPRSTLGVLFNPSIIDSRPDGTKSIKFWSDLSPFIRDIA